MKTIAQRRRFVADLEKLPDADLYRQLRMLSMDDLCALNEFASPRLKTEIQREMRNTDG